MRSDNITNQLKKTEDVIHYYKVKQKIAGDSWQIYRTVRDNTTYDIYLTGATTSSTFKKIWKVTYQVEGGKSRHPNAFAIFRNKVDNTIPFIDMFGNPVGLIAGFDYNDEISGTDPCVMYLMITAAYDWSSSPTDTKIGIKFRVISPYRGNIIFEELA